MWSDAQHASLKKELEAEVAAAHKEAERFGTLADGYVPPIDSMFEGVYKDMPAHLQDQLRQARGVAAHPRSAAQLPAQGAPASSGAAGQGA